MECSVNVLYLFIFGQKCKEMKEWHLENNYDNKGIKPYFWKKFHKLGETRGKFFLLKSI